MLLPLLQVLRHLLFPLGQPHHVQYPLFEPISVNFWGRYAVYLLSSLQLSAFSLWSHAKDCSNEFIFLHHIRKARFCLLYALFICILSVQCCFLVSSLFTAWPWPLIMVFGSKTLYSYVASILSGCAWLQCCVSWSLIEAFIQTSEATRQASTINIFGTTIVLHDQMATLTKKYKLKTTSAVSRAARARLYLTTFYVYSLALRHVRLFRTVHIPLSLTKSFFWPTVEHKYSGLPPVDTSLLFTLTVYLAAPSPSSVATRIDPAGTTFPRLRQVLSTLSSPCAVFRFASRLKLPLLQVWLYLRVFSAGLVSIPPPSPSNAYMLLIIEKLPSSIQ